MPKFLFRLLGVATLLLLSASAFAALLLTARWTIAPNYAIRFAGGKAEGTFSGLKGQLVFDPTDLAAARLDVQVPAATISTGNRLKDSHARAESWFDVKRYPTIRFQASKLGKTATGYLATGNLTLHGVTKPVSIPFEFTSPGSGQGVFTGHFTLNRHDYGIEGNAFGFAVGDEFAVELRVPVTQ